MLAEGLSTDILGWVLLVFGSLLFLALVSFIYSGSGGNWLGPYFGVLLPESFHFVFGSLPSVFVSIALILWGIWLLRGLIRARLFRFAVGFSILTFVIAILLALRMADNFHPSKDVLFAHGGLVGAFLVQNVAQPVFGASIAAPLVFCIITIILVFVIAFGVRPSHFAFVKVWIASVVTWWENRRERRETPFPETRALETLPKSLKWNEDYTKMRPKKVVPFKGPVGSFEGTLPVAASLKDTVMPPVAGSAMTDEIAEKERFLQENEFRMGAMEVRQLRDEIAELRRVRDLNLWEDNRHGKPSVQGIVRRHENTPEEIQGEKDRDGAGKNKPDIELMATRVAEVSAAPDSLEKTTETIYDDYKLPAVRDILPPPPEQMPDYSEAELQEIGHQLELQLENFKVKGKVVGIATGPMITRFEVEPGPGVKVSRFAALHEDLALALKAASIRILAPIPGKAVVGIEVPNRKLQTVYCRDIFDSPKFDPKPEKIVLVLGKDITGNPFTMDLARAPHVLIAGQTGSGKSVCINVLMASLLFSKTPDELRMILVDPKVVELKLYENIPHLLYPVITQPNVAVQALKWACGEMDRRYEVLAKAKVRNLAGYNVKVDLEKAEAASFLEHLEQTQVLADGTIIASSSEDDATAITQFNKCVQEGSLVSDSGEKMEKLPYIVIVIDELADLMMVAGKEVEISIARIAQKARAVGIHLVLATQRPSVNVITGLIKANLPTRISFKVASQIDARTVMDRAGAEKLLGRGDMLFRATEDPEPHRVHGAFLTDEEVEKLADVCSNQPHVNYQKYLDSRIQDSDLESENNDEGDNAEHAGGGVLSTKDVDPLVFEVALFSVDNGGISTSNVQRRFGVGFARAGRIVDQMQRLGICGPARGAKPREILMDAEMITNLMHR
jgi:DNA segregation ATPase FtsK/SpoIIIE-like protein